MQKFSKNFESKKIWFSLENQNQVQDNHIEPYSKITKIERMELSKALKQIGISVTSSHHHLYQYLMENITLPTFYKTAETISQEIDCICVRTIKKIKKEFESIGILTKVKGNEYNINRIHKTAEMTNNQNQSDNQNQEPKKNNQWQASKNNSVSRNSFRNQKNNNDSIPEKVGESANFSGEPCKKYPEIVQKMHPKTYYKSYKFNEEVLINKFSNQNLNSELYEKLKNYGLSAIQINKIASNFSADYIQNKINQLEFMLIKCPKKIHGEARYLYKSIQDDWICETYIKYLQKKEQENKIYQENQSLVKKYLKIQQETIQDQSDIDYHKLPESLKKLCSVWNLTYSNQ